MPIPYSVHWTRVQIIPVLILLSSGRKHRVKIGHSGDQYDLSIHTKTVVVN